MEFIMETISYVKTNWVQISQAIAGVVTVASIIVKMTPTLKDDNFLLPIVKFIGKYIALNKNVSDSDR